MTDPGMAARAQVRAGIFYTIAAVFVFSLTNLLVKWLVPIYPVTQLAFFRGVFALLPAIYLVMTHGGVAALRTRRPGAHAIRALIQFGSMVSIFIAFKMMPLADAIAITFAAPLFMTLLAIPMLGERVGIHRLGAVLVGLGGVIWMVRPGPGIFDSGAGFALANALLGALVGIMTRQMARTESSTTMVANNLIVGAILGTLLLPFGWVTPEWEHLLPLAALGVLAGVGQYIWVQGCRLAPASVAAPFGYMHMIWAILFGYLLWGDVPDLALVGGSIIVALSGLYILHRETRRRER